MPSRLRAALRTGVPVLLALAGAGLAARAQSPPDPQALLRKVRDTYRALPSFRIEGTLKVDLRAANGANQSFDSPLRVTVKRPGRIASEMKNPMLGMQYVSDGTQLVIYSEQFQQYTRRPLPAGGDSLFLRIPSAVSRYLAIDEGVKSARWVRDEALALGGRTTSCAVLEVAYDRPPSPQGDVSPTTYWIDRERSVVLRESLSVTADNPQAGGKVTIGQITSYESVDLAPTISDSEFVFHAPEGAKEVAQIGPETVTPDLAGKPAPDFALADLQGRSIKLSSLRGKVVLLDFWATWCGPCRIEMPRVQKLHKEFRAKGLAVYGVNVGEETSRIRPFLLKNGYTFPMLLDREKKVMDRYQVSGIPTLVIVDRKGTIHSYFVGVREDSVLRGALADLGIR